MKFPSLPSSKASREVGRDSKPAFEKRLFAHLAPSEAPFQSRHFCWLGSDLPELPLRRPDVLLVEVDQDDHATMSRYCADGEFGGQTYHASVEVAMEDAAQEYGESIVGSWQPVPEDESDGRGFAISQADASAEAARAAAMI